MTFFTPHQHYDDQSVFFCLYVWLIVVGANFVVLDRPIDLCSQCAAFGVVFSVLVGVCRHLNLLVRVTNSLPSDASHGSDLLKGSIAHVALL